MLGRIEEYRNLRSSRIKPIPVPKSLQGPDGKTVHWQQSAVFAELRATRIPPRHDATGGPFSGPIAT
jgi:hypothetical protein